MLDVIEKRFRQVAPTTGFWSLRIVHERNEEISVRRDIPLPSSMSEDVGAMITVINEKGGIGYGATCDLTETGLGHAVRKAKAWAERTAGHTVADFSAIPMNTATGEHRSPASRPWASESVGNKVGLLMDASRAIGGPNKIVEWSAGLSHAAVETLFVSSAGARIHQDFSYVIPSLAAVANDGADTQTRTFGGHAFCRQGGMEVLDDIGFYSAPQRVSEEALALLSAPDCPSGSMDLVLAPDQMILQIHESIGHPLELDRILGDERNYAGTSFVTPDMFGTYRYGSNLLNVVFDPSRPEQLATYSYDDEGNRATREFIIKEGILQRGLGSATSQARLKLPGVANARATSWNRPPVDRMANLNLEPGTTPFDALVSQVESGVYMETNCSWSIDDSRNKFQFGCELGRVIKNGKLGPIVKKPNYRGISATFWRNLKAVGDQATLQVMGTPNCGKAEPNQIIRVGHASPACLFSNVDVFGGA